MRIYPLISLLSLIFAAAAPASTVVSNIGNTTSSALSMNAQAVMFEGDPFLYSYSASAAASSFTTSGNPLPLESATLLLSSMGTVAGYFSVSILSDNAGVPGVSLVDLIGDNVTAEAAYTFHTLDFQSYQLEANTTYWLVAQLYAAVPNEMTTVAWKKTADLSETGSQGWTLGTAVSQSNDGLMTDDWISDPGSALQFSLNTAAIPEPASAGLLILSGCLLLRRNRRRNAP